VVTFCGSPPPEGAEWPGIPAALLAGEKVRSAQSATWRSASVDCSRPKTRVGRLEGLGFEFQSSIRASRECKQLYTRPVEVQSVLFS
jgi:hypothetical protein